MKRLKRICGNLEQYIAVSFLTAMLIGLAYNTVSRYFFKTSVSWMEEMCSYGLIWLVYMSVSYAVNENAHIYIDSVLGIYPKKLKIPILILGQLAWLAFAVIITIVGFRYMWDTFLRGGRAISIPIPLWIVYLSIPLGHACLTVRLIQSILFHVQCMKKGVDPFILPGVDIDHEDALNNSDIVEEIPDSNNDRGGAL